MLKDWDRKHPGRIESIFNSMGNVAPSHLLDTELYNFEHFERQSTPFNNGDMAFDQESFSEPTPDPDDVLENRASVIDFKQFS